MKDTSHYGSPDDFTMAPLLSLLPTIGDVTKLEGVTSSLYARYEKISQILREAERAGQSPQKFVRELDLLKEVLAWLAVTPEEFLE
jgi:hypothetical protein